MTPEQRFKQWVIRKLLSEAHVQTIETSTGSGVPDINACFAGQEFWIETKVATPAELVLLRPYQWAWMQRRKRAGGRVMVIAQADDDRVWIWHTNDIAIRQHGLYLAITTAPWYVGPRKFTTAARVMTF